MNRNSAPGQANHESNAERASRVRDNKRRHRARQKEYVLDLERRVAESREQGVQATKEVQLAAQRVARENARLRELLGSIGYTGAAIDAWLKGDEGEVTEKRKAPKCQRQMAEVRREEAPSTAAPEPAPALGQIETTVECLPNTSTSQSQPPPPPSPTLPHTQTPPECASNTPAVPSTKACAGSCTKSPPPPAFGRPEPVEAPCKLVTLLAKNPAADITQIPLPESESQACRGIDAQDPTADGVECATAYKMLIHYATSDEKMDKIAAALESGCTPSAGGGCKVKKSVLWKALDENCI